MIRKIATAAVYVDDQSRALEFWTKQVGFELRARKSMGPGGDWMEVAPPGAESCLVIYPKVIMSDWSTRRPSLVFESNDIAAACAQMEARGVRFVKPLSEMPWGKFAVFADTDGNEFGLRG